MYSYMRNVQGTVVGFAVMVAVGVGGAGCGADPQLRDGVFVMGSLDGEESEDWTFQGSEGEWVWIEARAEFEGGVELWSSESSSSVFTRDLTEEESQSDVGGTITSFWTEELPVSGMYRLRITANDGGSGSYQVAFGMIRSLERNSVATGRLGGDRYPSVGVWRFRHEVNEQTWLGMEPSANQGTTAEIVGPTGGEPIGSISNGGWHILTTDVDGWYEVRVTVNENERGYSIERGVVESVERDNPVEVEVVAGEARTRMWSFMGAMEEIEISVDAAPESIGEIVLRNEQSNLGTLDSGLQAKYTLADFGRHYVGVRSADLDHTYRLVIRPVRARVRGVSGRRLAGGETHAVVFEGEQGQEVAVSARSDEFDPMIEIFEIVDVGGVETDSILIYDDNSGVENNAFVAVTLPNDGRYRVVTSATDQNDGEYDWDMHVTDMALPMNEPISGELGGDMPAVGVWGFRGERNQEVGIIVTADQFEPMVSLSTPGGESLDLGEEQKKELRWDNQNITVAVARLPETGRYRLGVFGGQGVGRRYRVVASVVRGAPLFDARQTLSGAGDFRQRFQLDAGQSQTVSIVARSTDFDVSMGLKTAVGGEIEGHLYNSERDGMSVMVARNLVSREYEATVGAESGTGAFEIEAYREQVTEIVEGVHIKVLGSSGRGLWRVCAERVRQPLALLRVRSVGGAENAGWEISVLSYEGTGTGGGAGDEDAVSGSGGWTVLRPVFPSEDDRCSVIMVTGRSYGAYEIDRPNLVVGELKDGESNDGRLREENGFLELWYVAVGDGVSAIEVSAMGAQPTVKIWSPEFLLLPTERAPAEEVPAEEVPAGASADPNAVTERAEIVGPGIYWVEVARRGSGADSEEMAYQVEVTLEGMEREQQ